jgi:hypothetical protein
LLPCVQKLAT